MNISLIVPLGGGRGGHFIFLSVYRLSATYEEKVLREASGTTTVCTVRNTACSDLSGRCWFFVCSCDTVQQQLGCGCLSV